MRRLRAGHAALVAVLAAAVWAVLAPGARVRDDPGEVLAALRASAGPALPPAARAGARDATPVQRYGRETLADAIDGAAEAYLVRGFTAAAMATYAFGDGAAVVEVQAEAHRFASDAGARAQADAERPPRAAPVAGMDGAVSDGAVLVAVSGRDLLKLTALAPDGRAADALAALAGAWRGDGP